MVAKLKWVRISNDTIEHRIVVWIVCDMCVWEMPSTYYSNHWKSSSVSLQHKYLVGWENAELRGFLAMVTKSHFKMMIPIHLFHINRSKIRTRIIVEAFINFVSSIKFDQIDIVFSSGGQNTMRKANHTKIACEKWFCLCTFPSNYFNLIWNYLMFGPSEIPISEHRMEMELKPIWIWWNLGRSCNIQIVI